jgi:hypothetical protein
VDGTGSGSCPMAGFDIRGVEYSLSVSVSWLLHVKHRTIETSPVSLVTMAIDMV